NDVVTVPPPPGAAPTLPDPCVPAAPEPLTAFETSELPLPPAPPSPPSPEAASAPIVPPAAERIVSELSVIVEFPAADFVEPPTPPAPTAVVMVDCSCD